MPFLLFSHFLHISHKFLIVLHVETRRGGKHWARKGNSRSSRKNRIDACIRIYGDEYEVEDRKEKECPYGSGDLPYKGRSGK